MMNDNDTARAYVQTKFVVTFDRICCRCRNLGNELMNAQLPQFHKNNYTVYKAQKYYIGLSYLKSVIMSLPNFATATVIKSLSRDENHDVLEKFELGIPNNSHVMGDAIIYY